MSGQVRIGLIGVSHRAKIAENWHKDPRATIVGGADINREYLKGFKEKYGQHAFTTTNYRELLKQPNIDAIGVFTPDNWHEEHAVAALKAGKDCYLEKPMAITLDGCDRILKAWKESGKKLMVGHNMRYMDYFQTAKELIDSGTIGEIKACWVRHFAGSVYFHDYRANRKGSTSLLLQKGSHDIDMIHYLTGRYTKKVVAMGGLDVYGGNKPNDLTCPECPEKEVCENYTAHPVKNQCCYREEVNVEDHNLVLMELEDKIKVNYMECYYGPAGMRNYLLIGTKGTIETLEEGRIQVRTFKGSRLNAKSPYSEANYTVGKDLAGHGGADPKICRDFINLLTENGKVKVDPLDGRMSVAVGYKAAESLRNGSVVMEISQPSL